MGKCITGEIININGEWKFNDTSTMKITLLILSCFTNGKVAMQHWCETFVTRAVVTCPAAPNTPGFLTKRPTMRSVLFWVLTHAFVINKRSLEN